MINFSTNLNTFTPLTNLKPRVKGVDDTKANSANFTNKNANSQSATNSSVNLNKNTNSSQNSNTNIDLSVSISTNKFLVTDKSQAVGTSLGYGIDKDGYYTSDFNEAAGIPNDYKIHSSTMESFARIQENMQRGMERFISVDIAKAVGSAYKILSQVVDESILNSKDSFTKDEIAQFPQGYEFVQESFEVLNVYKTEDTFIRVANGYDYSINNTRALFDLFKPQPEMRSIFDNLNGGRESELGGVHWATTADKYTNKDGTITKGGLLIGIMNHNTVIAENATETEHIKFETAVQESGNDDEWLKNYKSPLMQMLEEIIKMQKELAQKALKKRLDTATQANAQNSIFVKDKSQATSEILGYGVDNDGFFTSDFNEAAGIAKDYKIYAKGAQNLVDYIFAHPNTHISIDFAKSLGNVYKLFSQIAPSTENSNFTKEQISTLPVGFEYDTKSFKVIKTYNYEQMQGLQDYAGAKNAQFAQIFPSQAGTNAHLQGKPSGDIFQSNPYIDIGANAYKNADGSVDKGGVLMAFFSARIGQFEGSFLVGETTIRGKLAGLDNNVSQEQIENLDNFIKQNPILYGSTDDLVARLRLKESNLSIDDFKTEWLKLKEKSDEIQAKMSGQTVQNSGANPANKTSANSTASKNTNATENSQNEQSTVKTSSSIQAKSDIFKDMDLSRLQSVLKNQHKFDLISILFSTNSSGSFGGSNGNDLNTNLMNLNLSKIKPLNKVDIKA